MKSSDNDISVTVNDSVIDALVPTNISGMLLQHGILSCNVVGHSNPTTVDKQRSKALRKLYKGKGCSRLMTYHARL